MKRFLSLVLTLVMVMSLVTVSAGAKDFTDDDKITYDEAVDVISTIGVVDGDKDGSFRPTDTLTRQAAAKIICNLILGPTTAAELHADTAPYRDVPANNQFAGYIAYCQAKGIISGYADGSFRPTGTLTGYAFMKMLLGALGYDASLENYVGANWSINVAKQALGIGLNKGLVEEFNGIKAVTRQEAALYAFNTLQADLVEYGQRLTTNVNGTEVTLSSGGAHAVKWEDRTQQTRYNTIRVDGVVQFAEEYFNLLVKTPDTDIFERPAHTWVYDKKVQIGTWVEHEKLLETYTTAVTARTLYDLLGSATIRDYGLRVYVDGHVAGNADATEYGNTISTYKAAQEKAQFDNLVRSNTEDVGITGKGVLTEVYKDDDAEEIIIVSIHTWLAQATSSYNENNETATVKIFTTSAAGVTKTVNVEDVPEVVDAKDGTFYLVTMSDKETEKLEVVSMEEPEILEESTITKFSNGEKKDKTDTYPKSLTTGGNDYDRSDRAVYDEDTLYSYNADLLTENTYNVYLDKYGYFAGIDLFEGTKQYVFITGYDMKYSNLSYKTAEASGIFLDGTMENITVNVKDTNSNIKSMVKDKTLGAGLNANQKTNSEAYYKEWKTNASQGVYLLNRWYTYTKTEGGVYTLKPCVDKNGVAMMMASKSSNDYDSVKNEVDVLKLNASRLRLDSVTGTPGNNKGNLLIGETMAYQTTGLTSYRAYGEDDSVFITVDVDEVSASIEGLSVTRAITGVNGRYTGVQDVNMLTSFRDRVVGQYSNSHSSVTAATAGTDTNWVGYYGEKADTLGKDGKSGNGYSFLGENVYAVFDKNNFIIGAVILGEAEGNNATKAYILDPVKYERYENGTYYWQFEAVINGEIVTQEAESKFASTIDNMRNRRYEVVELRYKDADQTIVNDVRVIDRNDGDKEDKIYGNQFAEIKRALDPDKESIYDVVLTGDSSNASVPFDAVWRPVYSAYTEHYYSDTKEFKTTELGNLNLQGRTLWVLGNHSTTSDKADKGIDFTSDAKSVVIQWEGADWDNCSQKVRAYNSVKEGLDSLSDGAVPGSSEITPVKEFKGIITAVLNSQGVAEWIVFYSDTLLVTRNSVSGGTGDDSVTKGNITVIANEIGSKNIVTSLSRDGKLTVAIPVPAGTTAATADIQVIVDGINQPAVQGVVSGNQLVFVYDSLNIGEDNNVVVRVNGKPTTMGGEGAFESVGSGATKTEIEDALDRVSGNRDENGNPVPGKITLNGNTDLSSINVPTDVEVVIPSGSSVTLGAGNSGDHVSGKGDVNVTGKSGDDPVDLGQVEVTGTITLGENVTATSTKQSAAEGGHAVIAGRDENGHAAGVTVVLDGGSIAKDVDVFGAVVVKSDLTITSANTFSANEINVEAGVTLRTDDLAHCKFVVMTFAAGSKWTVDLNGAADGGLLTVVAAEDVYIEDRGASGIYVNGIKVGTSGKGDALVYACNRPDDQGGPLFVPAP